MQYNIFIFHHTQYVKHSQHFKYDIVKWVMQIDLLRTVFSNVAKEKRHSIPLNIQRGNVRQYIPENEGRESHHDKHDRYPVLYLGL